MFENLKIFKSVYKKYKTLILSIIGLVVILLPVALVIKYSVDIASKLRAYPYIGADAAYKSTISVRGEGRVYVKPDIAIVDLSVITEGKDVKDVQEKNTEKINGVIDFLKDFAVEEKDIKTKNYRIQPRYSYEEGRAPRIVGYRISQALEVKIRSMDKIGEVFEGSVNVGVNQVSSLRFEVDNDDEVKAEARKLAIEDAKEKAKKLASDLGIKLIKISGFDEGTSFDYPIFRELGLGGGAEAPQIEVGENEIAVNVTLIYEID